MQLGSIGVWSALLRRNEADTYAAATELEELGFSTLWFPGREQAGLAEHIDKLLAATRSAVAATGIVSIWTHTPQATAEMHASLTKAYPDRFLLGIGISHPNVVQGAGITYEKPLAKLRAYLDALDSAPTPVPLEERILASLGPLSLRLSRDRSAGTHPYFMPVEHTRIAREAVGPGKIVAPELMVVVEADPQRARAIARPSMNRYLHAPNYVNNLLRLGFTQADIDNGGSDRLVDALIAWGEPSQIMQKVREHHSAGADHVCLQVLTENMSDLSAAMDGYRKLAPALTH